MVLIYVLSVCASWHSKLLSQVLVLLFGQLTSILSGLGEVISEISKGGVRIVNCRPNKLAHQSHHMVSDLILSVSTAASFIKL